MRGLPIRSQLLGVVVAALLPLLLVAIVQVNIALQDSRDIVSYRLRANAFAIAERQHDGFVIAEHALSFVSAQPDVRLMGPRCSEVLADAQRDAASIVNFVRTDRAGRARCSGLPFKPGQDLSRDPWWIERAGRRTLYLASVQMGAISKQPIQIIALPLFARDGAFDGTVSAGVSVEELRDALLSFERRVLGAVLIADREGKTVLPSAKVQFANLGGVRAGETAPQSAVSLAGAEWTYVASPLFRDQLFVIYAEPAASVTQAALKRSWPSLLLPLLAMLLTSATIWFAAQRLILRWLQSLRATTARFAQGDYHRTPAQFADAPLEIAALAGDLNDMADAIDRKEASLRKALSDRTELTREVNHRVKNNLQIVTSLLTMQGDRIRDPQGAAAINQARTRVGALGLVHRLMYDRDDEPGTVEADQLAKDLCAQLRGNYRHRTEICLECSGERIWLSPDQVAPVALTIVEAVTNAYSHAFPENRTGAIDVALQRSGDDFLVRVADDGAGFSGAAEANTIGIDLMRGFADQIEGSLDIETGPGGTTVNLRAPLAPALRNR